MLIEDIARFLILGNRLSLTAYTSAFHNNPYFDICE